MSLLTICCAPDTLLDHIPAGVEHYDSAMLWKSLRAICSRQVGSATVGGHAVWIFTPPVDAHSPEPSEE